MAENAIVTVKEGKLKGKINIDYEGKEYFSFQGVPYAAPPVGDLRFKAPQPPRPWSGVRDATTEGSECYSRHMTFKHIIGSEDCLVLNIFTPELPTKNNALKPVMLWIHGGGYTVGSGNAEIYGPEFLLTEDVVVVTINYRLGLLGFLSFEDPSLEVSGNAGLKDQVMALTWVQENISNFCGNPDNVTVFGESAGASSIHYLILSPLAKGLFHNAIMQSGSAFCGWAIGQRSLPILTTALNLNTSNEKEVLEILKEMPVEKLFELQEKIPDVFDASTVRPFGPVVENASSVSPFLTKQPLDIIRSGNYNQVPIMIGFNSREGMLSEIVNKRIHGEIKFTNDFEVAVPHTMKIAKGSDLSKNVSEQIRKFYYGSESPSLDNIDQFYLMEGDNTFVWAVHAAVKHHSLTATKQIYFYRVSVDSRLNVYKRFFNIKNPGVCHGDDVGYLFKTLYTQPCIPNSTEDVSVKRFKKLWTTFAKTGNPNPVNKDDLINVDWKPVLPEQLHFLDIGDNLTLGINPEHARMLFWQKIYSLSSCTSKL